MDKWRETARRLLACAVVAGVATAVLAACTPGGRPVVTETPSVSGSPGGVSVSPSPSASVDVLAALPAEARTNDLDGAVATAEFFLSLYAPMFHSGDTRLWEALSGENCVYCSDASDNARAVLDGGWVATGGEITPDEATVDSWFDGQDAAVVSFQTDFADAFLTGDDSTPQLSEAASRDIVYVRLVPGGQAWLIDAVMVGEP